MAGAPSRRHLHGLHDAGFPDRYMPFMEPDLGARLYARTARMAHGPIVRYLRERRMRRRFDVEPGWRRRGPELTTGYERVSAQVEGESTREGRCGPAESGRVADRTIPRDDAARRRR